MKRRTFLQGIAGAGAAGLARSAEAESSQSGRPKAPFKVLFSNDTTNILSCVSPYHKKGEPFTTERLQATVDEAKGVDVHMLQPGVAWIPWWKSKVYPADEHYRWFQDRTGHKPDGFGQYMLAGGDMVQVFVDRCRKVGQVPFVSMRMNDGHHLEAVDTKSRRSIWCSKFYVEHPEYRIGPDKRSWDEHVLNWVIPEVREHRFAFIREVCENYDIDGFEMDFMRHPSYFQLDKTPPKERKRIMLEFVARVRKLLDRTAKPGRHRWLCARVPSFLRMHEIVGIDLPAWVDAGLDMVDLSSYYFTMQQTDLATIQRRIPSTPVYLEMTHCTTTGPSRGGYDSFVFRRTTDHQFYTGAHLAYARGAAGACLFNFVYYREHGTPGRGPFNEPPFHVLERLGQPEWLAKQPQWYLIAKAWHDRRVPGPSVLPKKYKRGQTETFRVDMAPTSAQTKDGLLRLMTLKSQKGRAWRVAFNGRPLDDTDFVARPVDHPYEAALGQPDQYACYACPRSLVKDGINELKVTLTDGEPVTLNYIDVVLA